MTKTRKQTINSPALRPKRPATRRKAWDAATPDERCQLIVETALDLVNERDREAMTIRRVAQRLGIGAMTIYTYFTSQQELRLAVILRGFELLSRHCSTASTLGTPEGWRGSARAYIRFAVTHPDLYTLMFIAPLQGEAVEHAALEAVFQDLVERVRRQLEVTCEAKTSSPLSGNPHRDAKTSRCSPSKSCSAPPGSLDTEARRRAETYWIALHGLASLAIANRLGSDTDPLLDDLLARVAPSRGDIPDDTPCIVSSPGSGIELIKRLRAKAVTKRGAVTANRRSPRR